MVRPGAKYLGAISIQKKFKFGGWEDRTNGQKQAPRHLRAEEKANKQERRNSPGGKRKQYTQHRSHVINTFFSRKNWSAVSNAAKTLSKRGN